jgi:nucleotide-binding universal stress UspA family protein
LTREQHSVVVMGYDGSTGSQEAIARAPEVLGAHTALVVSVFPDLTDVVIAAGSGAPLGRVNPELDEAVREHAEELARQGAELARSKGLHAEAMAVEAAQGRVADTILRVARERDAVGIVVGSRGHGKVASALLGSVSAHLIHEADRPLVVVPAPRSD